MEENFSHLSDTERVKAENDFMKMKLMLEKGAEIANPGEMNPELENIFLKNVMAFEQQFEEQRRIKVGDKLGRPDRFKPASEIPEELIEKAWEELLAFMNEQGIDLDVCSPNISARELYRFTLEELFEQEMSDVDIQGWVTCFIYDEFHPDPVYDNTRVAVEDCIVNILQKKPMELTAYFRTDNLRLNQYVGITEEQLKKFANRFKEAYDQLEIREINAGKCTIDGQTSTVTGDYSLLATAGSERYTLSGKWKVTFELQDTDYWYISEVDIEGIRF